MSRVLGSRHFVLLFALTCVAVFHASAAQASCAQGSSRLDFVAQGCNDPGTAGLHALSDFWSVGIAPCAVMFELPLVVASFDFQSFLYHNAIELGVPSGLSPPVSFA